MTLGGEQTEPAQEGAAILGSALSSAEVVRLLRLLFLSFIYHRKKENH